jgi:CheY-like chemotaxis protein
METILIADDEPTLVMTFKFNLERQGYAVVTATDGEAAVAVARETHPDIAAPGSACRRWLRRRDW